MSLNTHGSLSRNSSLTSSPTPIFSPPPPPLLPPPPPLLPPPPPHHCHLYLHRRRPATNTMLALPIKAHPSIDERDLHQRTSKVPKLDSRSSTLKKSAREMGLYENHVPWRGGWRREGGTRLDGIVLGYYRWSWLRHPPSGRCHGGREPLWCRR